MAVGYTPPINIAVDGIDIGPTSFAVMPTVRPGAAPLAGGLIEDEPSVIIAALRIILAQQQQRYGNGEQPPVQVQHQPYSGPPLRYLVSGRPVRFCTDREKVLHDYETVPAGQYWPVPEYAAMVLGSQGGGVVRTRVNDSGHAPSAITERVANRLGLQHHPLRGAAVAPIMFGGHSAPVRALTEPLTVQLLAGPGNIAFQITIPVVLVVPSRPEGDQIELQLGLFDFCQEVQFDFLPLWASQFTHVPTGYSWALPVIAPQQRSHYIRTAGTSTFHITQECYDEVVELAMARQAVQARRAAAAAAAAGDSERLSPAEAAEEAMQQARHTTAAPEAAAAVIAPPAAAAAPSQVVGTQEWVDEWAPQANQQQQRQRRRRQQGRSGAWGRGRGSSSRQQQNGDAHADGGGSSDGAAAAAAATDDATVESAVAAAAAVVAAAAWTTAGAYAGLAPLPARLAAAFWGDVVASSLPEGDDSCCICHDGFTEELEGGGVRSVTQLQCRHTYCVLCLRQLFTTKVARRQPLHCPQCRAEV